MLEHAYVLATDHWSHALRLRADGLIGQGTFTLSNGPQRVLLMNKKGTEQGEPFVVKLSTKLYYILHRYVAPALSQVRCKS